VITIGIDPHKASLTAVACDAAGHQLGHLRLAVSPASTRELRQWAVRWPQRQWAVEGATGLGRGIAQKLTTVGEDVIDVAPKLAAQARLLGTGNARKTDRIDAAAVAAVARHRTDLPRVQLEDQITELRLLTERRDDVVRERTRCLNRLHGLLRDMRPGGAPTGLHAKAAAELLRKIRPVTSCDTRRKAIARDLLSDLRRHDNTLTSVDVEISELVRASGSSLTDIHGVGVITAAKILALTGDIDRFASQDHFASYCGTAPIEASSGDIQRHRLSRRGNRQLNAAIHVIAVCQVRDAGPGQDHYRRKIASAKTSAEARRSLKRRLSNVIYRRIRADQQRALSLTI